MDDGPPPLLDLDDIPLTPNIPETSGQRPTRVTGSSKRKERRSFMVDLPEMDVGQDPAEGQSRFDWRDRALSQRRAKAGGNRWFPDMAVDRIPAVKGKLEFGQPFHLELTRYKNHFLPLLQAEFKEEQRMANERLREWPLHKLTREGFTVDRLMAAKAKWQVKSGGVLYEFRRGPHMALPFHRFTNGTSVLISRTDPLADPVLEDGKIGPPEQKLDWIKAQVYSTSGGYIRIHTETPIDQLAHGHWRLDIGHNRWAYQTQVNAIMNMNYDPVEQDMIDVQNLKDYPIAPIPTQSMTFPGGKSGKTKKTRKQPLPEQTILAGTALRDKFLRAFQDDYVPYEPKAELRPTPDESPSSKEIVNDGIVAPPQELHAFDVDAKPVPSQGVHPVKASGGLVKNELIRSWTMRYRTEGEVVRSDGDPDIPLNPSQLRAIAMMLSERLSLVQGPPGTGKTRVIIETIKLLKKHWQIPHPILVTAHTNVAVDNLLAGLRQHGLKAMRIGAAERVRPDLQDYTIEELASKHPLAADIEAAEGQLEDLWKRDQSGELLVTSHRKRLSTGLKQRLHVKRTAVFADVLMDADVVCTTCLSAASTYALKHIDFPIVFLDEASMATEPLSLVPLMKGSSQVAIIGDHKQLPPVIISEAAKAGGLATSLFERLIHEKNVPSIMLDTQYRMHPSISAFPSQTFYNSDLKDGTINPDGAVIPGFAIPKTAYLEDANGRPTSMTFIDHDHPESPESRSIANHGDAQIISDIVTDLLLQNPGRDIGIIAPYAAQIRALDNRLNADSTVMEAMSDVLGFDRAQEVQDIEIRTVDGFEGREKAVIVFSTVRSNAEGWVGFLADWRRLNVGITRAKRGLIMVGSASTLQKAKAGSSAVDSLPSGGTRVWKDFIGHLQERGLIVRPAGVE